MKISGFTIARGAVQFGYQLEESIRSLLPLVDEYVVGVGDLDDGTLEMVEAIKDPKIKIFHSTWDMSQRENGAVLALETNKALEQVTGDWAVYLQADEVLHEDDLGKLKKAMELHWPKDTESLAFDYLHFYGSFQTIQDHRRKWYRHADRAIKTGMGIHSVGDAYGFRRRVGGKDRSCKRGYCHVKVYHYGWSRPPEVMMEKQRNLDRMYHDEAWIAQTYAKEDAKVRSFYRDRGHLKFFTGTHPGSMRARVAAQDWAFDHGIERQWPDWMRHLWVAGFYWLEKRWRRRFPAP